MLFAVFTTSSCIICQIQVATASPQIDQLNQLQTFNEPAHGITIDYPSNWQIMDTTSEMKKNFGGAPAMLLHKTFTNNPNNPEKLFVALGVIQAQPGVTLDQTMQTSIQASKKNPQLLQIDESSVVNSQLSGNPAYQYTYTSNLPLLGQPLGKVTQIDTLVGGKVYGLAFRGDIAQTDPNYQTMVQNMINSIRIQPTSSSLSGPEGGTTGPVPDSSQFGLGSPLPGSPVPLVPSDTGVGGSADNCNHIIGSCIYENPATGQTFECPIDWAGCGIDPQGNILEKTEGGDWVKPPQTESAEGEPPITEPPITEPPITEPPITEPPITEPPITEPPITEPPITEPPSGVE